MGRRTLTFSAWMNATRKALRSPDDLGDLGGWAVDDVATKLGVTRQAVHKMIDTDKLDAIVIVSKAGNPQAVFITQASLDHYLSNRRPYASDHRFTLQPSPSEG